jgi:hypothetical protein
LSVEDKLKTHEKQTMEKIADVFREFGLVNSNGPNYLERRNRIISSFVRTDREYSDFESLNELKLMRRCLNGLSQRETTVYQ